MKIKLVQTSKYTRKISILILISGLFSPGEPYFLRSEDILSLSILEWTERKSISVASISRDRDLGTSLVHSLSAQVTAIHGISLSISVCKTSHFGSVQTHFTFSFIISIFLLFHLFHLLTSFICSRHPLVLDCCFKAFRFGGYLGCQYQMKLKLHPHSKLETSQ